MIKPSPRSAANGIMLATWNKSCCSGTSLVILFIFVVNMNIVTVAMTTIDIRMSAQYANNRAKSERNFRYDIDYEIVCCLDAGLLDYATTVF